MKLIRTIVPVGVLLFALAAPVAAQHDRQGGQDRGKQQEKQSGRERKGDAKGDAQKARPRSDAPAHGREQAPAAHEKSQPPPSEREHGRAPARERETRQDDRQHAQRAVPRPPASYPHELRSEQQARGWQKERGWQRPGAWREHETWKLHRAERWDRDHRTWRERGGYGGYYIPVSRFSLYFGPVHYFRIGVRPVIVTGYPRFHYHGYWFMLVDPWPEFWAENWYETDDVYIDYDDGYYLHNRRHPGVSIAVSVVF